MKYDSTPNKPSNNVKNTTHKSKYPSKEKLLGVMSPDVLALYLVDSATYSKLGRGVYWTTELQYLMLSRFTGDSYSTSYTCKPRRLSPYEH